jgi:hypothetical protein
MSTYSIDQRASLQLQMIVVSAVNLDTAHREKTVVIHSSCYQTYEWLRAAAAAAETKVMDIPDIFATGSARYHVKR